MSRLSGMKPHSWIMSRIAFKDLASRFIGGDYVLVDLLLNRYGILNPLVAVDNIS